MFSYQDILDILKNQDITISDTTLKYYIRILRTNNIVDLLQKRPIKLFEFNNKLKEWKVPKR